MKDYSEKKDSNNIKSSNIEGNKYIIELGTMNDVPELEELYNSLNDHLASGINYPGWMKGVYPIAENAIDGIDQDNLFVLRIQEKIAGTIILNHEPPEAYLDAQWSIDASYDEILVIHTFAVHPYFLRGGVGYQLMNFASEFAKKNHMKALRLDVYEKNIPAIQLYEKCGYQYISKVDLGYGEYGLDWYKLYEKVL